MIYIRRDWTKVPPMVLADLAAAAAALDAIRTEKDRKSFIAMKKNQKKWTALRKWLAKMSHDKCWYSEARDSVGRLQVDHFRPHGRSKQEARNFSSNYSWLAFELDNFRLAGQLCNTINEEYSASSVGKGEWFPLLNPKKRATLARRIHRQELPLLLDPTIQTDVEKLFFIDDGSVTPHPRLDDETKENVKLAIRYLGLPQSALQRSRADTWNACKGAIERYSMLAIKVAAGLNKEEAKIMEDSLLEMVKMSRSSQPFTAVSRCCLVANGFSNLIVRDELLWLTK